MENPRVNIEYGEVEGFAYRTESGCDCSVFLGVPFASPPIAHLRFERPEPPKKWDGILMAKDFKPRCHPHCKEILEPGLLYDEDCLYANIMTPHMKRRSSASGYPVIVYVHGGGFVFGGPESYGYKDICENFVSQGIIFVTIGYRLGFLGFLTSGDEIMPGNNGLWDQKQALSFINDNIRAFGGDPTRITVMGQSAGAASVSALVLSPHCNGLFKQAICLSGSTFCEWSVSDRVCQYSDRILQTLCGDLADDIETAKEHLKKLPVSDFMDAVSKNGTTIYTTDSMVFHPRIDGDFFPDSVSELAQSVEDVPMMFGLHQAESAIGVLSDATIYMWNIYVPEEKQKNFSAADFCEVVENLIATEEKFGSKAMELQNLLIEFYMKRNEPKNAPPEFYLGALIELLSDIQFNVPVYIDMQIRNAKGLPTYFFVTDYFRKELRDPFVIKGSYHSDEYKYLFGFCPAGDFELNEDDKLYRALYVNSIANFAKTGTPSVPSTAWPSINKEHPTQHLSFKPGNAALKRCYNSERINFWTKIVPSKTGKELLCRTFLPGVDVL